MKDMDYFEGAVSCEDPAQMHVRAIAAGVAIGLHIVGLAVVSYPAPSARSSANFLHAGGSNPVTLYLLPMSRLGDRHVSDRNSTEETPPIKARLAVFDVPTDLGTLAQPRYEPAAKLDIGPLPVGSPDFKSTGDLSSTAGRIVLRVFVSTQGFPDRVEIIEQPQDSDTAQELRRALEQTTFLPGKRRGHDVPAFVDYEFSSKVLTLPPLPPVRAAFGDLDAG